MTNFSISLRTIKTAKAITEIKMKNTELLFGALLE